MCLASMLDTISTAFLRMAQGYLVWVQLEALRIKILLLKNVVELNLSSKLVLYHLLLKDKFKFREKKSQFIIRRADFSVKSSPNLAESHPARVSSGDK